MCVQASLRDGCNIICDDARKYHVMSDFDARVMIICFCFLTVSGHSAFAVKTIGTRGITQWKRNFTTISIDRVICHSFKSLIICLSSFDEEKTMCTLLLLIVIKTNLVVIRNIPSEFSFIGRPFRYHEKIKPCYFSFSCFSKWIRKE